MSEPTNETVTEQAAPAESQVTASAVTDAAAAPTPSPAPADDFILAEDAGESPEQLLHAVLNDPIPIKLPSGVCVMMRPGKGRDLLGAQRAAGTDTHQIMYGLIASLCTFDGQKKVLEDVLEMPLADVMVLTGKLGSVAGGDFLPSTTAASSTSPQPPAGATTS